MLLIVRKQLAEGERLAWAALPDPAALLPPEKPGIGRWETAGILGGGYAALGAAVAIYRTGHWAWLALPIAVFALVLTGYWISRTLKLRAERAVFGTVYVLTTQRALIVKLYPALDMQSLPIHAITDLSIENLQGDVADLKLMTSTGPAALAWPGVVDPERARKQILRVVRDPQSTDREIAASEAYLQAMRQLASRVGT
jgi:hypothetical protein